MTLLVTGAAGFVMSVFVRHWLETHPHGRLVAFDRAPLDDQARRYLAPVASRLDLIEADIARPAAWAGALDRLGITGVVHGATVTPISRGSSAESRREPEAERPVEILDINLMGTVHLLDWARRQPGLRRFVYVSSGGVYRDHGPDRPGTPLPEDGYVGPRKLYGISKWAAEMVAERYADLFGLSVLSVRLSSVYGTMDRVTASRTFRHVPNRIAHWAVQRREPLRVSGIDAVGDYIHAEDVAAALAALLDLPQPRFGTYNVALGETVTMGDMLRWAAEKIPGFRAEEAPPDVADLVQDAALRDGMWGAYDISRIAAETGWRPRPMRAAFQAYMDWIAAQDRAP